MIISKQENTYIFQTPENTMQASNKNIFAQTILIYLLGFYSNNDKRNKL